MVKEALTGFFTDHHGVILSMIVNATQWVLGHAHLSTTQLYVTAPVEDMIAAVLAHHERRVGRCAAASRA